MELDKLYFKNCKDVLLSLPDNSIDAFIQDPPFEVTSQDWDKGFKKSLPEMWELWKLKGKENAPFVFKATFPFVIDMINSNNKMFKYEWIWVKNKYSNFVNAKKMPMRCAEYLLVFYESQPIYNPILRKTMNPSNNKRIGGKSGGSVYKIKTNENHSRQIKQYGNPINVLNIPTEKDAFISCNGSQNRHPNRTPPALWEYMILTYTNENDIVFDGYSGSGSVPQACIRTNRRFIACENVEKFFIDASEKIRFETQIQKFGYDKQKEESNPNSLFFNYY